MLFKTKADAEQTPPPAPGGEATVAATAAAVQAAPPGLEPVAVAPRRTRGLHAAFTIIALLSMALLAAVLVMQVIEYLFYGQPPSSWIGQP